MQREALEKSKWKVLEIVQLYYIEKRTPTEIAAIMNVSPSTVSRTLSYAQSQNIVRTVVNESFLNSLELAHRLEKKFRLQKCILASAAFYGDCPSEETLRSDTTLESARYIQSILTSHDVIGVGWGNTVNKIINRLNPCIHNDTQFVLMNGDVAQCLPTLQDGPPLARVRMSIKGTLHTLEGKVFYESEEALNTALKAENVCNCLRLFPKITISICGVGSLLEDNSAELLNKNFFPKPDDLQKLMEKGACTNFLFRFFDANGKEVDTDLKRRTLSISIDQYKKIPRKILVAAGAKKRDAVRSVLNGGYVDILIVDEFLGRELDNVR